MKIIQWCLKNSLLLNLVTVMILVVGMLKVYQMNKEAFPSVDFDVVNVLTMYPGASPKETELYVTDPLEEELQKVTGIDRIESTSVENYSSIIIFLDPERTEAQKNKTTTDIQSAVDAVTDLPEDLPNPPKVEIMDSGDMPVLEVSLYGDMEYAELHQIGVDLKDRIEDLSDVKDAKIRGFREKEFWVEVDPKKLDRYNVGLSAITAALVGRNLNLPGGVLKRDTGDILVRTIGELQTTEEIANLVLRTNAAGISVKIKDVGSVKRTFQEQKKIYRSNGKPSINILVNKNASGDIINLVDSVKEVSAEFLEVGGHKNVEVTFINDISQFVKNRLGVLLNNGYIGIFLVLLVLLLFLSKGIAVVAAMGMPVALFGCLMVMGYMDMTINLNSKFGLVIVLGMLVDDGIFVAVNIWYYYENGDRATDACVKGVSEVFWPVTATIMTTIAAFSPLMMISGIFGKFIKVLPQVVVIALLASLVEAMLVLPSHAHDMLKGAERRGGKRRDKDKRQLKDSYKNRMVGKAISGYGRVLRKVLNHRYIFAGVIAMMFVGSTWFASEKMEHILFPKEGIEAFFVRVELDNKTTLLTTADKMKHVEEIVLQLPESELKDYVTHIGEIRDDQQDPFGRYGAHVAQVQVFLTPEKDRERTADDIIEFLREEMKHLPAKHDLKELFFSPIRTGPPVGKPVAIRIRGKDLKLMDGISDEIQEHLTKIEGVSDISDNYNRGKDDLRVIIDEAKAAQALLSVRDIALHVRAAIEGQISTYIRTEGDRIALRVRYIESQRKEVPDLINSKIVNRAGYMVPLKSVANFEESTNVQAIIHHNSKRTITVTANVDEKITSSGRVNGTMESVLADYQKKHPLLDIEKGGEYEDTDESMESLGEAFVIAAAMIFMILATQFKSLTQPLVIMTAIPLASIGVVIAFVAHNMMPISFLGMIGFIGLSGVVVNDSIVLVDFINSSIAKGMDALEATIHSGMRRFRAVWLTTLTTVFGLVPLVYGWGGQDMFLRPAATALGYGLIFGTVLVLFVVPTTYMIRIDIINFLPKIFKRQPRPTRERY